MAGLQLMLRERGAAAFGAFSARERTWSKRRADSRHGRACPGHPRLGYCSKQDVDARRTAGHDDTAREVLMPFHIGLLVFPAITQLDMTGPYEVFISLPDTQVHLVWKSREPVRAGGGMLLSPTTTFAECPQLDLICVPGGPGMNPLLNDDETLDFIR